MVMGILNLQQPLLRLLQQRLLLVLASTDAAGYGGVGDDSNLVQAWKAIVEASGCLDKKIVTILTNA